MRITGRLFDPADRGRCAVSVEGGLVTRIEADPRRSPATWAGPGAMILPGLIDAQVNGAFGIDFSDRAADIDAAAAGLPASGSPRSSRPSSPRRRKRMHRRWRTCAPAPDPAPRGS